MPAWTQNFESNTYQCSDGISFTTDVVGTNGEAVAISTTAALEGTYGFSSTKTTAAGDNGHARITRSCSTASGVASIRALVKPVAQLTANGSGHSLDLADSGNVYICTLVYNGGVGWQIAMHNRDGTEQAVSLSSQLVLGTVYDVEMVYDTTGAHPTASIYVGGVLQCTATDTSAGTLRVVGIVLVGGYESAWTYTWNTYYDKLSFAEALQSGSTSPSSSDSAALAEQVAIALGQQDSAALAEQIKIALSATDGATLGESMAIALAHQDAATLQELVSVAIAIADAATTTEQASTTAQVSATDATTLTDTASKQAQGGTTPSDADTASVSESASIGASTAAAEIGALAEQAAIQLGAPDGALLAEQISTALSVPGTDSAALLEQLQVAVTAAAADSVAVGELQTVVASLQAIADAAALGESTSIQSVGPGATALIILTARARPFSLIVRAP